MPSSSPTLRDMVNEARDHGQTYKQLAARAIDPETGQRASLSLIHDLARDKVDRMPYDYHLRAIAVALSKPYEQVRRAAIAQWLPADDGSADAERDELVTQLRQLRELADRVEARVGQQDPPAEPRGA